MLGSRQLQIDMRAWLLLLPSLVFMMLFTVYPIIRSFYLSFHDYGFTTPEPVFVGLKNFNWMFGGTRFWKVMRNTVIYTVITFVPSIILGLAMAMCVNGKFRGLRFMRVSFVYPTVMPMIAITAIWMCIYMDNVGLLEQILNMFGIHIESLLGRRQTVLGALAAILVWRESGYLMIFYLSGLQNLPVDVYEAATVDGAKPYQVFTRITLPLLGPTFLFVFTLGITDCIKMIDHIDVLTAGGPNNASMTLLYYIYQVGYTNYQQGRAAALTVVLLVILLIVSVPRFFSEDKKVFYQ